MMFYTGITKKEQDCPYVYLQNNMDVTVNYLYGSKMPHSTRFFEVECYVRKTGVRVPVIARGELVNGRDSSSNSCNRGWVAH